MDRTARAVLMRAAVIGRRFSVPVLTATASCSESKVRAALEEACGFQLISAENPTREFYMFRHALTRDIIYAELLTVRMRPFHRSIAIALERAYPTGDAPLEDLAYHSWAAADAARALRYNEQAGDNAAAVHAQDDARTYYVRARSLLEVYSVAYERLTTKLIAMDER
jgi:predicted ATPase